MGKRGRNRDLVHTRMHWNWLKHTRTHCVQLVETYNDLQWTCSAHKYKFAYLPTFGNQKSGHFHHSGRAASAQAPKARAFSRGVRGHACRKSFEFSLSRIVENAPNLLLLIKSVHRFQQIDRTLRRCVYSYS